MASCSSLQAASQDASLKLGFGNIVAMLPLIGSLLRVRENSAHVFTADNQSASADKQSTRQH